MRRLLLTLLLFAAVSGAPAARAQAPQTISYQGVLTDASGSLVPDGNYVMQFRLYDVATGGGPFFIQGFGSVPVQRGGFSVSLGPVNAQFDRPFYLGISVAGDPEMTPRVALTSSPYALGLRMPLVQSLSNSSPLLDLSNTGAGPDVRLHGRLEVGTDASDGTIDVYRSLTTPKVAQVSAGAFGGTFAAYDEVGGIFSQIAPDVNGTGGFFNVFRNTGSSGFTVDGNFSGSSEPHVTIAGSARSVLFQMDQSGNASVTLPTDAIAATEILDEPGVASTNATTSTSMDGTVQTILSRTITCPADGYCLVIGSLEASAAHSNGTTSTATFGVSNVAGTFPATQDVPFTVPSAAASGTYVVPVTVHGLFSVTAGANTFFLLGHETGGAMSFADRQLSVVFLPTAYGTVTSTLTAGDEAKIGSALTSADVAAEQREAQLQNQARLDREMAAMREQVAELQRKLESVVAQQATARGKK